MEAQPFGVRNSQFRFGVRNFEFRFQKRSRLGADRTP